MFTFGGSTSSSGSSAPPTSTFGGNTTTSPVGAGGGSLFGSASTSAPSGGGAGLFGNLTAPAPAGSGGLFGSAPSPAPGGGLFGSTTSGGLFGGSNTPDPSGTSLFGSSTSTSSSAGFFGSASSTGSSLFGAPSPSSGGLFGSSGPSSGGLFGSATGGGSFGNTTQQASTPAIPAQAALQAHIDASARQEATKLQSSLEDLHHAYAGTPHKKSSPLVTIVYNTMTSEQLQWYFSNQQAGGGLLVPPKPPQVSDEQWLEAVVRNPDRSCYIPIALIGAESLQARVGWQQQQASGYDKDMAVLKQSQETIQRRIADLREGVMQLELMHSKLRSRLLRLMNKVEVVRCMNLPLQADEMNLVKRLQTVLQQLDELTKTIAKLQGRPQVSLSKTMELPDRYRLQKVLTEHRSSMVYLSEVVQREKRDIRAVKERVANP